MFKYLFKRDTILATIMVFVVMSLLALIPINTHILNPIKMSLQDFDYNDLSYSRMGKNENTAVDTNIVIVNIGMGERKEIAEAIYVIETYNPKVIGVDVLFEEPKGVEQDSLLHGMAVISSNIVFAYNLHLNDKKFKPSGFLYNPAQQKGYVNFVGEHGGVIRHFAPAIMDDRKQYFSFAASVVKIADENKFNHLLKRDHQTEIIHYTRRPDKYVVIDAEDVLSGAVTSTVFQNKIVLIGLVVNDEYAIEDKHFTPMNKNAIGKSLPDMNGIFIHANIISMMLGNDYIQKISTWLVWLLAVLICWVHMSIFLRYFVEHHIWFHIVAKVAQILSAVLFVYLGLILYHKLDFKLNMTPSLVAIILGVDVLYFYEAICNWLHKKYNIVSVFNHHNHH